MSGDVIRLLVAPTVAQQLGVGRSSNSSVPIRVVHARQVCVRCTRLISRHRSESRGNHFVHTWDWRFRLGLGVSMLKGFRLLPGGSQVLPFVCMFYGHHPLTWDRTKRALSTADMSGRVAHASSVLFGTAISVAIRI